MTETLNSLIKSVRNKLKDYPSEVDYLASAATNTGKIFKIGNGEKLTPGSFFEIGTEAIFVEEVPYLLDYMDETAELSTTATAFSIANSARFVANDIIKMDNEYMLVSKVSAMGSDNVKVTRSQRGTVAATHNQTAPVYGVNKLRTRRGQLGTSASAHAVSAVINVIDGWTDFEIREMVKTAIRNLYPDVYRDYVGKVNNKNEKNFAVVDDCDTADWTQGGDGIAEVVNTTDYKEGTACLNLGAIYSIGSATYTKTSTSVDASNCNYLTVWLSMNDHINSSNNYYLAQNAFTIRLGNDSSNYYQWIIQRNDIEDDDILHPYSLSFDEATETGTVDKTAIDYPYIAIGCLQDISSGYIKMDAWIVSNFPYTYKGRKKYRLPKGVFGMNKVRLMKNEFGAIYKDVQNWHLEGDYETMNLVFDDAPASDYPMEFYGRQMYLVPSANTTNISGEFDFLKEMVVLDSAIRLIDNFIADRVRYDKYVSETNINSLDIYRSQTALKNQYNELLAKFGRSAGGVDLDWTDLKN